MTQKSRVDSRNKMRTEKMEIDFEHENISFTDSVKEQQESEEFHFLKVFDWLSKSFSEDVCKNALCTACF